MSFNKYIYKPKVKVNGNFVPAYIPMSSIYGLETKFNELEDSISVNYSINNIVGIDQNSTLDDFMTKTKKNGIFVLVDPPSNFRPENTTNGVLEVFKTKINSATLIFSCRDGSSSHYKTKVYTRIYRAGAWGDWVELERTTNKVTSLSNASTDEEYPSAKCVYDAFQTKQDVIDSTHKLDADYVDDASTTNKFVTASDKTNWNGKQDASNNSGLNTTDKSIVGAINEVDAVAKGANQAKGFASYSALITEINSASSTAYKVGQSFFVQTLEVPDLWILSVENSSSTYTYTTDAAFITATGTSTGQQVGYYKLAQLETQKVDLSNYVPTSRTIAGVDLVDNITKTEMLTALNVADGAEPNAVASVNGATGTVVLDADDISDTNTTNKFVTSTEKSTWNGKQAGDTKLTSISGLSNSSTGLVKLTNGVASLDSTAYTTNTGTVTSVRVQAGTGLSSSTSTAQTSSLNTTISVASGYKLPTTTEWNNKADVSDIPTSVNGMAGGTLTSTLTLANQSDSLVLPNDAMIKTSIGGNSSAIFGYDSTDEVVNVGSENAFLSLFGSSTRPYYSTGGSWSTLALYSDIKSPSKIKTRTCSTLDDLYTFLDTNKNQCLYIEFPKLTSTNFAGGKFRISSNGTVSYTANTDSSTTFGPFDTSYAYLSCIIAPVTGNKTYVFTLSRQDDNQISLEYRISKNSSNVVSIRAYQNYVYIGKTGTGLPTEQTYMDFNYKQGSVTSLPSGGSVKVYYIG